MFCIDHRTNSVFADTTLIAFYKIKLNLLSGVNGVFK
jgi:hypothetical protein